MPKSILIIEPDEILGETFCLALSNKGYLVNRASSAKRAVEIIDKHQPDLIMTEIQLVGHSGIELLYELRSYTDWTSIPVLILSIVPPSEFKDSWRGLSNLLNINAYLYKPSTSLVELIRKTNEILASVN